MIEQIITKEDLIYRIGWTYKINNDDKEKLQNFLEKAKELYESEKFNKAMKKIVDGPKDRDVLKSEIYQKNLIESIKNDTHADSLEYFSTFLIPDKNAKYRPINYLKN